MASVGTTSRPASRPSPSRLVSFPKHPNKEDGENDRLKVPTRASTFQNGALQDTTGSASATTYSAVESESPDAFETGDNEDADIVRASVDMGELPIELVTLCDSFIDSLSAKVHPTPPNADNLARLFQDFYVVASTHINTHIAALASRQRRDLSPSSSRASAAQRLRAKAASIGAKDRPKTSTPGENEQQMLTAEELAERKRARRALEQKRVRLEEAIERRLCEGIYSKIYRHRSTQDEAQDDKLRSKTAALALVGINLVDLGIDLGELSEQTPEAASSKAEEIKQWLDQARKDLLLMNEKRYPVGKLNHLKAAHKSIVDTLAHFHPSASADEIMPMMIYTLITLAPEKLNVISDMHFIQRFRCESKLNGEAAYCLTTLEAAISFLETVDLSTLRADELPSGPSKTISQPGTPRAETFPPAYVPGLSPNTEMSSESEHGARKPSPLQSGLRAPVQLRNRRLSDLVNTPAQAIGAASDTILTTADQSLKNISNSLGDSYKFLVGKLLERQAAPADAANALVVPKTLDDARKLVSTPPPDEEESISDSSAHSPDRHDTESRSPLLEETVLHLIGGRKVSRDHSADSARSASSLKRIVFAEDTKDKAAGHTPAPANTAVLDSVRNFGNSLNPMARFSSLTRGFGRPAPAASPIPSAALAHDGGDLATAFPDIAPALPPKDTSKIAPPNKRFMEMQNPGDLKLNEVLELLRDYRRLAGALQDRDAFRSSK